MQYILVTGGTGVLGRVLVAQLVAKGHRLRAMSRSVRTTNERGAVEYVYADLATGIGVADAVVGVDAIIHAASAVSRQTNAVDVEGTRRLMAAAHNAGVHHVVYMSIVGIDHIPVAYYWHKLAAEAVVTQGNVPWSIQRATQFHPFLAKMLADQAHWPVLLMPTDFRYQPIDVGEVAQRLCDLVAGGVVGRAPDLGGPDVLTMGEAARIWLRMQGLRKFVLHLPLPGTAARAFRTGAATCPDHRADGVTWAEWLKQNVTNVNANRTALLT